MRIPPGPARPRGNSAGPAGRNACPLGASALLEGWRESTIDVDLKIDPEPQGIFEAIAELKNELDINIELASPDQFLPEVPDWRDRSTYIERQGSVDFFHYDFRAQALAKLARGHDRDLSDVREMIGRGLVDAAELALTPRKSGSTQHHPSALP